MLGQKKFQNADPGNKGLESQIFAKEMNMDSNIGASIGISQKYAENRFNRNQASPGGQRYINDPTRQSQMTQLAPGVSGIHDKEANSEYTVE